MRQDRQQQGRKDTLYPSLNLVDTAIIRLAERAPRLPMNWPGVNAARDAARGFFKQSVLHFRPDAVRDKHALYFADVLPALEREGATLAGFFDTLIGPGSMNAGSHRSVELRRFADLAALQRWHEAQDTDESLRRLLRERRDPPVERVESLIMRPLPYSRIR